MIPRQSGARGGKPPVTVVVGGMVPPGHVEDREPRLHSRYPEIHLHAVGQTVELALVGALVAGGQQHVVDAFGSVFQQLEHGAAKATSGRSGFTAIRSSRAGLPRAGAYVTRDGA